MIKNATFRNLFNFVLFQVLWFLCVLQANRTAAILALFGVALHLVLVSRHPTREARFIIMAAALGVALDTLWQNLGVLRFPYNDGAYAEGFVPVWLVGLWLAFVTTLGHSLAWIRQYPYLPFLVAPIAGPLAYYGAAELGPVEIGHGVWGIAALALGWLLLLPLQLRIQLWLEQPEGGARGV